MVSIIGYACGSGKDIVKDLISQNKQLVQTLRRLLPVEVTLNSTPIPRPVKWIHQFNNLTTTVIIALSNIACHQTMTYSMITDGTLKSVIELSAHPNSTIQY